MNFVESYFNGESFGKILTFAIFVVGGLDVSRYVPTPKRRNSWIGLAAVTLSAGCLGAEVSTVTVLGYGIYLNMVLLGLCCGFIVGFLFRMYPRFKMR